MPRFGGSLPQLAPRETTSGHLTLPVYSSLEGLQERHGAHGHALRVPSTELDELRKIVGFATVALDISVPDELRLDDWDDDETEWPTAEAPDPEIVWVPCRPLRDSDEIVQIELHPDETGEVVLAAFTSKETLVAGCGEYQPAAAFSLDDLAGIAADVGADAVAYDPTLRAQTRHGAPRQHAR